MTGKEVVGFSTTEEGKPTVLLNNNDSIVVDKVIVAIGLNPNDKLAQDSGFEIDPILGGILGE
jgi:NAD(P)H-nitrite reductase large subunit